MNNEIDLAIGTTADRINQAEQDRLTEVYCAFNAIVDLKLASAVFDKVYMPVNWIRADAFDWGRNHGREV